MKLELIAIRLQRSMQLMFKAGVYSLKPIEGGDSARSFDFHANGSRYRVTVERIT